MRKTSIVAVAAVVFGFHLKAKDELRAEELQKPITISEGKWDGEVRKGEDCIFFENARLKLTILKKGAYIISVADKRDGEEFINCSKAGRSSEHGIYDRIDETGRHSYRLTDPKHLANHEYEVEQAAPDALRFTCQTDAIRVVRTVKLDPVWPKFRVGVTYTSLSTEAQKLGILLLTQLNLNKAPVSYNQAVVMPGVDTVDRFVTREKGHYGANMEAGWWLVADRDSKKSVVLTYTTDGSIEAPYLYRIPMWIHLLPMTPVKIMNKGDSIGLWQEYHFLSGKEDAEALSPESVTVKREEFARLKAALLEELATDPVKPGQPRKVALPEPGPDTGIEPPLGGKPDASVVVIKNAVYDHPTKMDRQTWLGLDRLLQGLAEVKGCGADLMIVSGASANGEQSEFDLTRQATQLTGLKLAYAPNHSDLKQIDAFEKTLGPKNSVHKVKDVTFICYAPKEDEWLRDALAKAEGRVVVIGHHAPPALTSTTNVTLALCWQNTTMPCFARVGNWPVLNVPHLQFPGEVGVAVINIFPDYLDVLVKPLGGSFGPRLYVGNDGKSPALGVPPFITGKPLLKVAHMADTQLNLPSRVNTPGGEPLDQANMKKAIAEINALGVDFAVNAGDLVNVGSSEEQWSLYNALKKPLKAPLYEVLGNHDWDQATIEGEYVTTTYAKFIDDPLTYDIEKNGIFFMVFGTAVTKGDDLRQRRPRAEKAKCTVLLYHDPITTVKGYNWWKPDLYEAAHELKPTITMCGHTHRLRWEQKKEFREFIGSALGWTKTGDAEWNGFFLHLFYEDKVVSSYKRLGCDDLFFTVVTPYRGK